MPTGIAQATAIAARLHVALGAEPRIAEAGDTYRITAVLPEELSATQRTEILAVLADADQYGHSLDATGRTVWAVVPKEVPMAYCHYHKGASGTAVAVKAIESGSGPGGFLFACAPCREQRGLTPLAEQTDEPQPNTPPGSRT